MEKALVERSLKDRIRFLLDEEDPYPVEVAGLAGALVRLGVHDEELFAEVREVNYGEIYDEDPTSIVEGLKKAAEYQVGLTPAKVLSSSMEHVIEQIDREICAARFLGLEERAREIEMHAVVSVFMIEKLYGAAVWADFAEAYAEKVGADPHQVLVLKAILESKSGLPPEEKETVSEFGMMLNMNRYFKSQSKMIH
jgi:hypothetical protein